MEAGRHVNEPPWQEFQFAQGEYEELERQLREDELLFGFVEGKIRYDYDAIHRRVTVRMPTSIHDIFIQSIEEDISRQLSVIREETSSAATFAKKVRPIRSTDIVFPVDAAPVPTHSKYSPDAAFCCKGARYPGVILEVSYGNKKKRLGRLAQEYILHSKGGVQVVVGLDIDYGKRSSRRATLSVWRFQKRPIDGGNELGVLQELTDETFRDEDGNPTDHSGLLLHLSDFTCQELAQAETGDQDRDLTISAPQLCEFLTSAEDFFQGSLVEPAFAPGDNIRWGSVTPPQEITLDDEARFVEQEERAAKHAEDDDLDYNYDTDH